MCAFKIYIPFQSLCKNLERAETRRWLAETLDTLMKERAGGDTLAKCNL